MKLAIHLASLLALLGFTMLVTAADPNAACCTKLKSMFPSSILTETSKDYKAETTAYWSSSNWLSPKCVFVPQNAEMVAEAMKVIVKNKCEFAVRSGGHSTVVGAAATDKGVLIAMSKMRHVDVQYDYVRLGPGSRWTDVYNVTDKHGVVVLGGRLGAVGVGGLVLGGGVSFQAAEHGLACDTVRNYQVVTADGKVREVNEDNDADLFWALKGGSNQYGIVTRFDMNSFKLGRIYGGTLTYNTTLSKDKVMKEFSNFQTNVQGKYPKASVILNIIDATSIGVGSIMTLVLYYGEPVKSTPDIFKPFLKIPGILSNTLKPTNMSPFAAENAANIQNGPFRNYWRMLSYRPSPSLEQKMADIFTKRVEEFRSKNGNIAGLYTYAFEPLPLGVIKESQKGVGNALGLDPAGGPLTWIVLTLLWLDAKNDQKMIDFSKLLMAEMIKEAQKENRYVPKLYLNAASIDQPVFANYGAANLKRLKAIKKKYDPRNVFSTLQPGGFHLD